MNNATLLLILVYFHNVIYRLGNGREVSSQLMQGLLFGGVAVGTAISPMHLSPTTTFDIHFTVVCAAGLFGGSVTAALAAAVVGAFRLWQCGVACSAGVLAILTCAGFGAVYHYWRQGRPNRMQPHYLMGFGLLVHLAVLVCFLVIPSPLGSDVIGELAGPLMTANPMVFTLLAMLLHGQQSCISQEEHIKDYYRAIRVLEDGKLIPRQNGASHLGFENRARALPTSLIQRGSENTENALREAQSYKEKLIQQSKAPIVVWNNELRITILNQAFEKMTGRTAQEMLGKRLSLLFPEQTLSQSLDKIVRTSIGEHWDSEEIPILHKDGSIRLALWNSANIYEKDGVTMRRTIALGLDITERKQVDERLRLSEEMFAKAFHGGGMLMAISDVETGRFIDVNEAFVRITGYSRKEAIGTTSVDLGFLTRETRTALKRRLDRYGRVEAMELCLGTKAGAPIRSQYYAEIIAVGGKPRLLSMALDVSDLKRAEDSLRAERDKLQGVLSSLGQSLFIIDRHWTLEYQNEAAQAVYGNHLGETCHWAFKGLDRPCEPCAAQQTIRSGDTRHVEIAGSGGKAFEVSFAKFVDSDGENKVIVVERDITEERTLRAEAIRAGHLASLGELAAGVAHEINNPINGIINCAQLLIDRNEAAGQVEALGGRIIQAGDRIAAIVGNLLSFARYHDQEAGPVCIKSALLGALDLVATQLAKDGIEVKTEIADDLPLVKGNRQQLQQVFLNIFSNAHYSLNKKFLGSDADKVIEIKGRAEEIEGRVLIRLTFLDYGLGIPALSMDRLCEPFFSTKPAGEGTGLGLSISHGIISNHGGNIRFDSVEGRYAKVLIQLPAADAGGEA